MTVEELGEALSVLPYKTPVMIALTIGDVEYEAELDATTVMWDKKGEDALWLIGTAKDVPFYEEPKHE